MQFHSNMSILYSDTPVPEIFITEYMPSMEGCQVKVYIYCLFLSKHGLAATPLDISKKLDLDLKTVNDSLAHLEFLGLIKRESNSIQLIDLKEKEIKKLYRPKLSSTPEEAALSTERNKRRNAVIRDINTKFFQGVMSPSWYTDIDSWFEQYGFEEDVMFALFEHCYAHNGLAKQYIEKVAESWYSNNIKNGFDLDQYSLMYEKFRNIKIKITKKIRRRAPLTQYEEELIEKWVTDYDYDFDIIELALRRTTSISNPNFKYIDAILTDWHNNGLKTKEAIEQYEEQRRQKNFSKKKDSTPAIPQKSNFNQRQYDDEFFDKLYKEIK
jgi:DnaD/phage-associated family protein